MSNCTTLREQVFQNTALRATVLQQCQLFLPPHATALLLHQRFGALLPFAVARLDLRLRHLQVLLLAELFPSRHVVLGDTWKRCIKTANGTEC